MRCVRMRIRNEGTTVERQVGDGGAASGGTVGEGLKNGNFWFWQEIWGLPERVLRVASEFRVWGGFFRARGAKNDDFRF